MQNKLSFNLHFRIHFAVKYNLWTKHSHINATPTIKEEAETSADSLTIDVEGHDDDDLDSEPTAKLMKTEFNSVEDKAWIQALRTHVVVPLIRHPKSISFRKPVDPIALGKQAINLVLRMQK